MKKYLALLLALCMIFSLAACGQAAKPAAAGDLVGVAMPTKDLQRWNQDGENMKAMLEKAGYQVDLQYGANDIATQVSQIENMIANGCKVLVIASIDGDSLGTVLAQAKEKNIPVIAYDRLIMNSDAVSYYATFDNWLVGTKQGEFIEEQLGLKDGKGPYNIEFITGDPGDNNINFFFDGAMSILQQYLDNGQLVCPSGQTEKAVVATQNWATDAAQARFENILSSYYADKQLDAVLASNDSTACGVENALASSYSGKWPVITGQDCDIAIMGNLIAGKQGMSVFKDTRTLAAKVVEMVDALMKGQEPPINDTETYNNGVRVVPSFLCEPVACTVDNYKELLIDSGYYTYDQLGIDPNAPSILLAMGNSDVPVGQYTQKILAYYELSEEALANAGLITYGSNVKEVTTQVKEGSVSCGVVYGTDAFSAGLTPVDSATKEMCGQVIYPAAVMKNSKNAEAAQAFLDYLCSDAAMAVFENVGFSRMCEVKEVVEAAEAKPVELFIFAAASMTETLNAIKADYEALHPNVKLVFTFDSSGTLKTQIESGAECDVFISAAPKQMNALDSSCDAEKNPDGLDFVLQGSRINLLENKVVLVVPDGNPDGVTSFDALAATLKAALG